MILITELLVPCRGHILPLLYTSGVIVVACGPMLLVGHFHMPPIAIFLLVYLGFVHLYSFTRNVTTKYYTLFHHEVTFLPVEYKVSIFTSLQKPYLDCRGNYQKKFHRRRSKSSMNTSIDGEVAHLFFYEISEYSGHASLKSSG
jgi:hypothetical protein